MFKIDKIKSIFNCDQCSDILVNPITIACGNSICMKHLDKLVEKRSKKESEYKCEICHNNHSIPKEGFIVNKRIQSGLDIELNTLKLTPAFDECKKALEEARASAAKIESLEKNSENDINEYFANIVKQVDLRREMLKVKIDNHSDEIINSINKTQLNCIKHAKEINKFSKDIGASKTELNELAKSFDTIEINDKKFENIKCSAETITKKFDNIHVDYKQSIIENKRSIFVNKKYSFVFSDKPIVEIFGKVIEKNFVFDSKIFGEKLEDNLINLCKLSVDQKWDLRYRASRDGFAAKDFHDKCDGIPNTLTVIKTTNGYIFGGFTTKAWHSNGGAVTDPNAYIFSLVNKDNKPFKVLCSDDGKYAICCKSTYGPSFGSDGQYITDIFIDSDSNISHDNRSNFGYSYKHPDYLKDTFKAKSILAGSFNFQSLDIEVFSKIN